MGLKAVANPAAGGQPGSFTSLTATSLTVNGGISVATGNIIGIGTQQAYMFGDASAAEVGSSTNSYKVVVGGGLRAEVTPSGLTVSGLTTTNTLRVNVTPTAEVVVATHTAVFNINGTNYKFLCLAA